MNANEQTNYADMIEVPINTCTVTAVPSPKKRGRRKKAIDNEAVKSAVIDTVNKRQEDLFLSEFNPLLEEEKQSVLEALKDNASKTPSNNDDAVGVDNGESIQPLEDAAVTEFLGEDNVQRTQEVNALTVKDRRKKSSLKNKIIAISLVVGVVGAATVGGAVLTDSLGLTSYFSNVFSADDGVEVLEYEDYTAYLPCGAEGVVSVTDGVMNVTHKGSVYASTDGKVSKITRDGELFILEITHGEDFKTVISGIDYAYVVEGDEIFGNIPVGYSNGNGYTVCLYSADGLITEYDISGGTVVWNSTTDGETVS